MSMTIDRIRNLISKITLLKVLICAFIIVILFFYLKTFFTTGVYFHDAFLKKQVLCSEIHYTGTTKYGKAQIIVKGLVNKESIIEVDYILPNNINKNYKVEFENIFNSEIDMGDIEDIYVRDSRVGIENIKDEDGNVIFPGGVYKKYFSFLFEKNGEPFMDVSPVMIDMENAYNNNYKLPLNNVVAFATSSNDVIR